ncbi:response regulator [Bradyrhizobium diazoefficiens]|uniref:response regulator n=1 Tax=Bradyrhizobium diazoefficiens TaxID=1355477 RepID=UPI00190CCC71|nr:response regulator [Bradyrhizobium diazoefficiens]QQO34491.1 response regulator [Bradyrhizobium diazoefficiens]
MTDSLTVLVAEDDYQIQEMLEEALSEAGFRPQILSSAEEAATVLRSGIYEFRALVTDVGLKGATTGWDLARLVRERAADFPVVYVTGTPPGDWARLGVPNSILLTKPFAPAQLVTAVAQLLNTGGAKG